jgi:hypothetical protein
MAGPEDGPGELKRGTGVQLAVALPAALSICAGTQITILPPPVSNPASVSVSNRTMAGSKASEIS